MGVIAKKELPQLKELLLEMNQNQIPLKESEQKTMTLFLSFDIVNSTRYKSLDKDVWSLTISKIIRRIISGFSNNPTGGYDFWKTLGDEIIYTRKVATVQDLLDTLEEIYRCMVLLNKKIKQKDLFEGIATEMLSVKASAWLADVSSSREKSNNVLTYYQINDKRKQADYIGPDIDAGFRASYYSTSNRMIISFEIACLLMNYKNKLKEQGGLVPFNFEKRVQLLTRKVLKGVWDGVPYPILLFHGDIYEDFEVSITKKEIKEVEVIQEYLDQKEKSCMMHNTNKSFSQEEIITNIIDELHLNEKIERLMDLMNKEMDYSYLAVNPLNHVCYHVACYTIEDQQIKLMLVKDKNTGLWSFGDAQFHYDHLFVENLEQAYLENYGSKISIEYDGNYQDKIPMIVSLNKFSKDYSTYSSYSVYVARIQTMSNEWTSKENIWFVTAEEIDTIKSKHISWVKEMGKIIIKRIEEIEYKRKAKRIVE